MYTQITNANAQRHTSNTIATNLNLDVASELVNPTTKCTTRTPRLEEPYLIFVNLGAPLHY